MFCKKQVPSELDSNKHVHLLRFRGFCDHISWSSLTANDMSFEKLSSQCSRFAHERSMNSEHSIKFVEKLDELDLNKHIHFLRFRDFCDHIFRH